MCLIDVWNYLLCEIGFLYKFRSSVCEEHIEILIISPRRAALAWAKVSESHICHYVRVRLGELESLEREILSSKRTNLAWARIRSDFWVAHCKRSCPSESSSSKRDNSLAQARSSNLSKIHCRIGFLLCFRLNKAMLSELMWWLSILYMSCMNNSIRDGIVWIWFIRRCDGIRLSRENPKIMVLVNVRTWGLILMVSWQSNNH